MSEAPQKDYKPVGLNCFSVISNSKVTFSALHRFKIEIAGIRVLETRGRKKDMMAAELTSSS
jgi:hypothetical protein